MSLMGSNLLSSGVKPRTVTATWETDQGGNGDDRVTVLVQRQIDELESSGKQSLRVTTLEPGRHAWLARQHRAVVYRKRWNEITRWAQVTGPRTWTEPYARRGWAWQLALAAFDRSLGIPPEIDHPIESGVRVRVPLDSSHVTLFVAPRE